MSDFQASIKSFDNFILEFPGTVLREKAMFHRFDSAYKLAINSVTYKKEERLKTAITYYGSFNKAYTTSEFKEAADKMNEELNGLLQEFNTKS